ncbi:MAG: hypothetical protein U0Y08_08490 [Bacteroidia bacterium]
MSNTLIAGITNAGDCTYLPKRIFLNVSSPENYFSLYVHDWN